MSLTVVFEDERLIFGINEKASLKVRHIANLLFAAISIKYVMGIWAAVCSLFLGW
jgi:hypothetical protein